MGRENTRAKKERAPGFERNPSPEKVLFWKKLEKAETKKGVFPGGRGWDESSWHHTIRTCRLQGEKKERFCKRKEKLFRFVGPLSISDGNGDHKGSLLILVLVCCVADVLLFIESVGFVEVFNVEKRSRNHNFLVLTIKTH